MQSGDKAESETKSPATSSVDGSELRRRGRVRLAVLILISLTLALAVLFGADRGINYLLGNKPEVARRSVSEIPYAVKTVLAEQADNTSSVSTYSGTFRLPEDSLYGEGRIYVIEPRSRNLVERKVELLAHDDQTVIVRGDLKTGENVLASRIPEARNGLLVKPDFVAKPQGAGSRPGGNGSPVLYLRRQSPGTPE